MGEERFSPDFSSSAHSTKYENIAHEFSKDNKFVHVILSVQVAENELIVNFTWAAEIKKNNWWNNELGRPTVFSVDICVPSLDTGKNERNRVVSTLAVNDWCLTLLFSLKLDL